MRNRSPAIRPRPPTARCPPKSSAWPASCQKPSGSRSASSPPPTSSRISTRRSRSPARGIGGWRPRNRSARPGMTLLFDKLIVSPGLAPTELREPEEFGGERNVGAVLTIGLVNNMPDAALQATERQFMRLLEQAAGNNHIRFHCFSLPSVQRSQTAKWRVDQQYTDIADLPRLHIDGLIVTGADPNPPTLPNEPSSHTLAPLTHLPQL